jgi:quinohemoprotein ethanol dehydrogenase
LTSQTGAFKWRFYTVPRDPKLGPQDQPHLQAAVKTWARDYDWSNGGGGSAWDGLAYDPKLRLVYVGHRQCLALPRPLRSSRAAVMSCSCPPLLRCMPTRGALAWHFQEVPGEIWDYDTANKMILADLNVGGALRGVIMQASKDGFFYVLDRATGEFLSGKPFAYVNWTRGSIRKRIGRSSSPPRIGIASRR